MKYKAIILDLDNTIYSVYSIGEKLFETLFELYYKYPELNNRMEAIKNDTMRKPFQKVVSEHQLPEELAVKGLDILRNLDAELEMTPFEDYSFIRQLECDKFLVTVGFAKMQEGKINNLGIKEDFKEIHIIDPEVSKKSKKDVFEEILKRHHFLPSEVLVVGDDPFSEIKAANELGLKAVLYDRLLMNRHRADLKRITDFKQLRVTGDE